MFVSYRAARRVVSCLALTMIGSATAASLTRADDIFSPLPLRHVKVGGEIGRRIDITINNNLLVLQGDQAFLHPFLQRTHKSGYIGLGKLIDAATRFAAYTGDAKVIALKDHLVDMVIRAQQSDGYIGMMVSDARMHQLWDVHEMGYLVYGLATDYDFFKNERSLQAARKAADYIIGNWAEIPSDWGATTGVATHVAVTGLERAMLLLGRLTGNAKYVDFCRNERGLATWDLGIVMGRRPLIEGHIYAYACRSLAALELYRLTPNKSLLRPANRAVQFLTNHDGAAITGGAGLWETWTDDQDGRTGLAETCATAYLVRLYSALLAMTGESRYGDLMERTIFNTLFAAQSPDGRHIRYYTPTEGPRVYHSGDTYCCPCNYRRIIAELPTMVYYRAADGVAINLLTASQATLPLPSGATLHIAQESKYPSAGRVVVHIDPDRECRFTVHLRVPAWCPEASFRVNDGPTQKTAGGKFLSIDRTWKRGATIHFDLPMPWRLVLGRKRQSGRVALMRGPLVFCLNPSQDEALADQDGADLGHITLDPESLGAAVADDSVRPGGVAVELRGWKPGYQCARPGNLKLQLTEFADPGGRATYFRLQEFTPAVPDELLRGN